MEEESSAKKLKIDDIYFVLFRRKWVIIGTCLVGLFAGALAYKLTPRPYSSQAELLVRFVMDSSAAVALLPGSENQIRNPSSYGESILNNEREILSSLDLAKEVARTYGPERILEEGQPGAKPDEDAAQVIVNGLQVQVAYGASILNVVFSHPDPEVSQAVLKELLRCYLKRHAEIHLKGADYELLAKQTEELRLRLQQTEQEVNDIRSRVGGVSLEESKAALSKELASIRSAILETEMQLAALSPASSPEPAARGAASRDGVSSPTNTVSGYGAATLRLSSLALMDRAQALRTREQDYLSRFTEDNPLVKSVRLQIAEVDRQLDELATRNPEVVLGTLNTNSPLVLAARMKVLTNQLQVALGEANRLNDLENQLTEVMRRKEIQEQNYKHLATSLERERFDTALEFSKLSNIVLNQEPSPPLKDSKAARKRALMALGGIMGGGLALVFLFELFLDPRLKRASQLDQHLSMPHFLSIPRVRGNGAASLDRRHALHRQNATGSDSKNLGLRIGDAGGQGAEARQDGELRSYYQALRDRIVIYFDRVNLRRKPKLVGLAGCHAGAGVSTIAQGLAEALSETGGGKVLLVNLNGNAGKTCSYLQGRPALQLNDALDRPEADVAGGSEALVLASLEQSKTDYHPVRSREFDQLIPRLKASDFDYIVFDMPPLQPTSVSYRLAGFLDKMLLIAESEKTHLESLKRSAAMLQESNARVATVLNKTQEYVPGWLRQSV